MVHTELGDQLRRAREAKSFSLEDVEKATGIRKRFIQAMEEGRFDALPGEIQLRGFLRKYASHVGLNGDDLLAVYERRTHPTQTKAQPAPAAQPMPSRPATPASTKPQPAPTRTDQPVRITPPVSTPPPPTAAPTSPAVQPPVVPIKPSPASSAQGRWAARLPAWLTLEIALIGIAAVTVLCIIVLVVLLLTSPSSSAPPPDARPTATRTRSAPPMPPSATLPPETSTLTLQPNVTSSIKLTTTADFVQVALAASEHVWVRVMTDGKTAFEGMFAPGQTLKWEAKDLLIVETGNGAGLNASFNGKPVGVFGPRSQIVARAWTPTGETSPPKPTPPPATPTATP